MIKTYMPEIVGVIIGLIIISGVVFLVKHDLNSEISNGSYEYISSNANLYNNIDLREGIQNALKDDIITEREYSNIITLIREAKKEKMKLKLRRRNNNE